MLKKKRIVKRVRHIRRRPAARRSPARRTVSSPSKRIVRAPVQNKATLSLRQRMKEEGIGIPRPPPLNED